MKGLFDSAVRGFGNYEGVVRFFDGDRCETLAAFLKLRHPFVDEGLICDFCRQRKIRDEDKVLVPDIIPHGGVLAGVYEVKPASTQGRKKGRQRLRNLCELDPYGMPYCEDLGEEPVRPRGIAYTPQCKLMFWTGTWQGIPAKVSLQFTREADALFFYKYCVEISGQTVADTAVFLRGCLRRCALLIGLLP